MFSTRLCIVGELYSVLYVYHSLQRSDARCLLLSITYEFTEFTKFQMKLKVIALTTFYIQTLPVHRLRTLLNKVYFTCLMRGRSVCSGHCISEPSDSSSAGQVISRPLPASLSGGCCCRAATRVNGRYCRHSNLHVYIAPARDSIQWQPFSNLH